MSKSKIDLDEVVAFLHTKLSKGLDKSAGKDIKPLSGILHGIYRIKFGQRQSFRLAYEENNHQDKSEVNLLFFGKTDDPSKKNGYYDQLQEYVQHYKNGQKSEHLFHIKHTLLQAHTIDPLTKYFEGSYRYSVKLSDSQENIIQNIINSNDDIFMISGVPGSGKTVVGAEVISRLRDNGFTNILLILPNEKLIEFYINVLGAENIFSNKIKRLKRLNDYDSNKINIVELEQFIPWFSENSVTINNKNETHTLLKNFYETNYNKSKLFESFEDFCESYYALLPSEIEDDYYPKKDALYEDLRNKFAEIRSRGKKLIKKFENEKLFTKKEFAEHFSRKIEDENVCSLLPFNTSDNFCLIADEIQDFLFYEWYGLLKLCYSKSLSRQKKKFIFIGDEKQRVLTTAFSWQVMEQCYKNLSTKHDVNFHSPRIKLQKNYRVTKQIADLVTIIDSNTINDKKKYLDTVKKEHCINSGSRINVLVADEDSLNKAVTSYLSSTPLNAYLKLIVITENSLSLITKNKAIEALRTWTAKGTEHNHVVLLNPFAEINKYALSNGIVEHSQNYKLYTQITRSRNILTIIANQYEYNWLKKEIEHQPELQNSFHFFSKMEDSSKNIINILRATGLENLSLFQILDFAEKQFQQFLSDKNSDNRQKLIQVTEYLNKLGDLRGNFFDICDRINKQLVEKLKQGINRTELLKLCNKYDNSLFLSMVWSHLLNSNLCVIKYAYKLKECGHSNYFEEISDILSDYTWFQYEQVSDEKTFEHFVMEIETMASDRDLQFLYFGSMIENFIKTFRK